MFSLFLIVFVSFFSTYFSVYLPMYPYFVIFLSICSCSSVFFLSFLRSSPCLFSYFSLFYRLPVFKLCPIIFFCTPFSPSLTLPVQTSQFLRLPVYLFVSSRPFPSLSHVPTLARPHHSLSVTSQTPSASGLHAASTARHQDRRGPITNPSISHWPNVSLRPSYSVWPQHARSLNESDEWDVTRNGRSKKM